jgi:hypothetical protein
LLRVDHAPLTRRELNQSEGLGGTFVGGTSAGITTSALVRRAPPPNFHLNKRSGPLWRGSRSVGQPCDVGSPCPAPMGVRIGRCRGPCSQNTAPTARSASSGAALRNREEQPVPNRKIDRCPAFRAGRDHFGLWNDRSDLRAGHSPLRDAGAPICGHFKPTESIDAITSLISGRSTGLCA